MTEKCAALITGHGGFYFYSCGRTAKGERVVTWGSARGQTVPVCGIHQRAKQITANR